MSSYHRLQDVRFSERTHEYPVFRDDPPVVVQGNYQPPPAPRLAVHSLPGTPEVGQSPLRRDNAALETVTDVHDAQASDARNSPDTHSASLDGCPSAPTNSPVKPAATTMGTSPLSVSVHNSPTTSASTSTLSPAVSPTRSLQPASDLCQELQHFPIQWPVREKRLASLVRESFFPAHAFSSGRKTCTLHFQGAHASDEWDVAVGPRKDGRSLSVEDVLARVDRELYKQDGGNGFYESHPRLRTARAERMGRAYGPEDAQEDILRNIDFFDAAEHRFFVGLEEMPSSQGGAVRFRVCLGA